MQKVSPTYIILLTAKIEKEDVVAGLEAGADDYLTKPFVRAELRARIEVGERVIKLQTGLADRVSRFVDFVKKTDLGIVAQDPPAWCMKSMSRSGYLSRMSLR